MIQYTQTQKTNISTTKMQNITDPIDQEKLVLLKQMVENAEKNVKAAKQLLTQVTGSGKSSRPKISEDTHEEADYVVEGTFDGESMIGSDGKQYPIPANYASKSKLVEGDTLKLSILPDGTFIFKQIGPAARQKVLGTLMENEEGEYYILANGKSYKVLTASVTYFKGQPGDQVTLVIPQEGEPVWGAIENLVKEMTNITTDTGTSVASISQENTPDVDALDEELKAGKDLL